MSFLSGRTSLTTVQTGDIAAGAITGAKIAAGIVLPDYGSTTNAIGSITTDQAFVMGGGNSHSVTITANTITLSFSGFIASDDYQDFTITMTNGGLGTLTWTNGDWAGGSAPGLTSSGVDVITGYTIDGGTTVHLMVASTASA